jgi:hypothetical protein
MKVTIIFYAEQVDWRVTGSNSPPTFGAPGCDPPHPLPLSRARKLAGEGSGSPAGLYARDGSVPGLKAGVTDE